MDSKTAYYNPNEVAFDELPVIYGFNNGGEKYFFQGVLIAQDGTILGSGNCTSEGAMLEYLGMNPGSRPDRHIRFQEHYPDGYRMEFIGYGEVAEHAGLQEAFHQKAILDAEAATE